MFIQNVSHCLFIFHCILEPPGAFISLSSLHSFDPATHPGSQWPANDQNRLFVKSWETWLDRKETFQNIINLTWKSFSVKTLKTQTSFCGEVSQHLARSHIHIWIRLNMGGFSLVLKGHSGNYLGEQAKRFNQSMTTCHMGRSWLNERVRPGGKKRKGRKKLRKGRNWEK